MSHVTQSHGQSFSRNQLNMRTSALEAALGVGDGDGDSDGDG